MHPKQYLTHVLIAGAMTLLGGICQGKTVQEPYKNASLPIEQRVEDLQEGNYELGLTRWGPDYDDPMTYLGMWKTNDPNNYGFWSNSEYDSILDECTTGDLCTEVDARRARLYDAEKIAMEDAVIFPIYTQANAQMIKSNVSGIEFHPVALNRVYKNTTKN